MSNRISLVVYVTVLMQACASTTYVTPGPPAEQVCGGIDEGDRAQNPFTAQDILEVRAWQQPGSHGGRGGAGATLYIRSTKGMTSEWMQRVLECRIATGSANDSTLFGGEMSVFVESTGNGFAVRLSSRDHDKARRILQLAKELGQGHDDLPTPQPPPALGEVWVP